MPLLSRSLETSVREEGKNINKCQVLINATKRNTTGEGHGRGAGVIGESLVWEVTLSQEPEESKGHLGEEWSRQREDQVQRLCGKSLLGDV